MYETNFRNGFQQTYSMKWRVFWMFDILNLHLIAFKWCMEYINFTIDDISSVFIFKIFLYYQDIFILHEMNVESVRLKPFVSRICIDCDGMRLIVCLKCIRILNWSFFTSFRAQSFRISFLWIETRVCRRKTALPQSDSKPSSSLQQRKMHSDWALCSKIQFPRM